MEIMYVFSAEIVAMEITANTPAGFKEEMQVDPLPVIRVEVNGQQTYVDSEKIYWEI